MKKIAIVFLGDHYFDARCINMIKTLSAKKCSVTIYSTSKKIKKPLKIFNDRVSEVYIKNHSVSMVKYLDWTLKIYRKINKKSYDVVIASDLYSLLPLVLRKNNHQTVYDSREIYTKLSAHINKPIKNKIISLVEKFCVKKINKIIVTAQSDLDYLKKLYPKQKISYKTIYNYPLKSFIKLNSSFLRNHLKINKKNTILLYQGVLQKHRGIIQLMKIVQNTTNTVGVIIGSGEYKKHILDYIQKHNLNSTVRLLPAVTYPQLLKITSSADIGVSLINPNSISNKFALPNKIFEYSASGLPVLSSSIPNINKHILKYNLGWSVEFSDLQEQIKIISNYQNNKKKPYNTLDGDAFYWEFQEDVFFNFLTTNE